MYGDIFRINEEWIALMANVLTSFRFKVVGPGQVSPVAGLVSGEEALVIELGAVLRLVSWGCAIFDLDHLTIAEASFP